MLNKPNCAIFYAPKTVLFFDLFNNNVTMKLSVTVSRNLVVTKKICFYS